MSDTLGIEEIEKRAQAIREREQNRARVLSAIRLRAQQVIDLGFALQQAKDLVECYDILKVLSEDVEGLNDLTDQVSTEDLGYVGDVRKMRPRIDVEKAALRTRLEEIKRYFLHIVEEAFE